MSTLNIPHREDRDTSLNGLRLYGCSVLSYPCRIGECQGLPKQDRLDETERLRPAPYKTLSLSMAHNDGNSHSTFVITHVDIGGQGTDAAELLRKLSEASRNEEGNLRFDVLQHAMRANISRLSKNGRPPKRPRRTRPRCTLRNIGTAWGRSPAALWTNAFIKPWSNRSCPKANRQVSDLSGGAKRSR
jgi:hypothetical protein